MTKISVDEVTRIAVLARLGLSAEEVDQYAIELTSILSFVDELNAVDTKGVEVTSQVTGLTDVWRQDEIKKCAVSRDELLQNAPEREGNFVKVKRVL